MTNLVFRTLGALLFIPGSAAGGIFTNGSENKRTALSNEYGPDQSTPASRDGYAHLHDFGVSVHLSFR